MLFFRCVSPCTARGPLTHAGVCASFFKTLVEHEITVELKNEVQIRGTLKSVDQYLNIKLDNAEAVDEMRWPHLVRLSQEQCAAMAKANPHVYGSALQKTCSSEAP